MDLPLRLDLGDCTVTVISGGALRLDGGAMFGIIPKPLWSRSTPSDEQNRIQLACNCLLVEWQHETARRVIIETGHGPKYNAKDQSLYAIDPSRWLLPALRRHGVDPATISDVIVTHMHFDHAGGLTHEPDGLEPTFPHARVHVQRRELEDARTNFGIMRATYRPENYEPIDAAGAWELADGERVAVPALRSGLPSIRVVPTPGHTRGHQSVIVEGRDRALLFPGDVMPTRAHVGAPYNMAYDLFPLDNRASKERLLKLAAERGWLIVIDHDPASPVVRVVRENDWFRLEPLA
jgi:glyoxylase-like metal-dependent hydrolase (beta-lactamase superfamily II)